MRNLLKILFIKNNSLVQKSVETLYNVLKVPKVTYSVGKVLYTANIQAKQALGNDKTNLDYYSKKYENAGKKVTSFLQDLLNIRKKEAIDIAVKHKNYFITSLTDIENNYAICMEEGLKRKNILDYPEVLLDMNLYQKLQMLKEFSEYNFDVVLPLVRLSLSKLQLVKTRNHWRSRIGEISEILEVPQKKACEILSKMPFLFSLQRSRMESNLHVLKWYGVSKEEILNDLWVLRYNTQAIREKFDYVQVFYIVPKTWMVRCTSDVLEKHIQRENEKRGILGDSSVAKYLSERLNCSEEMGKYMLSKQPALASKNLKKVNRMIDFLIENGFSLEQICKVPKILLHSVETTKKRMREIEAISTKKDYLYILTKSQKQYLHHLDALAKAHGKKLT